METIAQSMQFAMEILQGLTAPSKYLPAKYFYDKEGDAIFQEIMHCNEYYPFACELEIFRKRSAELAAAIEGHRDAFDLIELGAGDCKKSAYLLRQLVLAGADFTYVPIDISSNIIDCLQEQLPLKIPGLKVSGLNGEYLPMLTEATNVSSRRKVVLFLGGNLGNMSPIEARVFCRRLRAHLKVGDSVLIGFDLKKCPETILAAYNDRGGITRRFNLNLLSRINRELSADFDVTRFRHFPVYDPFSGACKSYLISLADQVVTLRCNGDEQRIVFMRDEEIFMEISQKYTIGQVDRLAGEALFRPVERFYDNRRWFVDVLWEAV
ncbi:MAG: L-histidine N(alpha)-methyltransferase [Bacteroidetes bacterium]|nr:L-histidine N(alpha)-methyltransferase [Bacteroidota bacterium]